MGRQTEAELARALARFVADGGDVRTLPKFRAADGTVRYWLPATMGVKAKGYTGPPPDMGELLPPNAPELDNPYDPPRAAPPALSTPSKPYWHGHASASAAWNRRKSDA